MLASSEEGRGDMVSRGAVDLVRITPPKSLNVSHGSRCGSTLYNSDSTHRRRSVASVTGTENCPFAHATHSSPSIYCRDGCVCPSDALKMHQDLRKPVQEMLQLLAGSSATQHVEAIELRSALDAIRDITLTLHAGTKFVEGSEALVMDDDANSLLAIVFMSSLLFLNESTAMNAVALEDVLARLTEAERTSNEKVYHNAVVDAVNHILLFTPLAAPPEWVLHGLVHKAHFGEVDHRCSRSMALDPLPHAPMETVSQRHKHPPSPLHHGEGGDTTAHPGRVLHDDCLDYLSMDKGIATLSEPVWLDTWLSWLQCGYERTVAALLHETSRSSLPLLRPRPYWRVTDNGYAQFAVQLLAIFFVRGSDGSLNYCARVHRLVRYYQHQIQRGAKAAVCGVIHVDSRPGSWEQPSSLDHQLALEQMVPLPNGSSPRNRRPLEPTRSNNPSEETSTARARAAPQTVLLYQKTEEVGRLSPEVEKHHDDADAVGRPSLRINAVRYHKCYMMSDTTLHSSVVKRVAVDET